MKTINIYYSENEMSFCGDNIPQGYQVKIYSYIESSSCESDESLRDSGAIQDESGDWYQETIISAPVKC